ncbi:MAG TPA: gluconate 2-dehydrogenase subunit 3 family protein [Acidimicrobiales bacterium]|nr:gluconate 2-dehydrogenase subunit 3 family protein [Acidimicrobiales bacterium]
MSWDDTPAGDGRQRAVRGPILDRRRFLSAALAAAGVALVPLRPAVGAGAPKTGGPAGAPTGWFLRDTTGRPLRSTCRAACARIVPSGSDPATDPGADQAGVVDYIDMFLAAFELPASVADGPLIYLHGSYSGRNPYPDYSTGGPSGTYPPDAMEQNGRRTVVPLDGWQELSWRVRLYGAGVVQAYPWASSKWFAQLEANGLAGPPGGLRALYADGLSAFDEWSRQLFGVAFAVASAEEQDYMLESAGGLPVSPLLPPNPPDSAAPPQAARDLFPYLVVHTYEGCYGLPEYGGNRGGLMWRGIGWDGDTVPLGNSVYDAGLEDPAQSNAGFGQEGVYLPVGGYRQHRPVSAPDPGRSGTTLDPGDAAAVAAGLSRPGRSAVVRP